MTATCAVEAVIFLGTWLDVILRQEISLVKTRRSNEWLGALKLSMKIKLAGLPYEAYGEFAAILAQNSIDCPAFNNYLSEYAAQVVVLGTKMAWTAVVEKAFWILDGNFAS